MLCDGFNLVVSSHRDRRGSKALIVLLPLWIKQWGLFILLEFTLSTSCHHTSCITIFVMNLKHSEASIEALSKWSNSSR